MTAFRKRVPINPADFEDRPRKRAVRRKVRPRVEPSPAAIVDLMLSRRRATKCDDGHARPVTGLHLTAYVKREPYTDPATVEGWLYRKGLAALRQ